MSKVTREMIAAAHDVTMRHKIVLGHELLTEIYQAMDAKRGLSEAAKNAQSIIDSLRKQADLEADALDRKWALEMIAAIREALAEQGCDYCNHPQYAGTKCKNCGREQPAQDQGQSCYCPECERLSKELAALKAQQQQEPVAVVIE